MYSDPPGGAKKPRGVLDHLWLAAGWLAAYETGAWAIVPGGCCPLAVFPADLSPCPSGGTGESCGAWGCLERLGGPRLFSRVAECVLEVAPG